MLLAYPQFVRLVESEIGLEGQVQRQEYSEIGQEGQVGQLEGSDPLQHSSILVDHFSLFEVQVLAGVLTGHLDKRLVSEGGMIDILLEFQQPVEGSPKELRMAEPVRDVLVLFFRFDWDVIFVALAVVVVAGDGPMQAVSLPLLDVLEGHWLVPDRVPHEPVLVGEGPGVLIVNIPARESEIRQLLRGDAVRIDVSVNTRDALLVGPVQFGDGVPNLPLKFEIKLEILDDLVIGVSIGLIVVLVKFRGDVIG